MSDFPDGGSEEAYPESWSEETREKHRRFVAATQAPSMVVSFRCDCGNYVGYMKFHPFYGLEGLGELATGVESIADDGTPLPGDITEAAIAAFKKAHGELRTRYRLTCSACGTTLPVRAEKLAEVARRIHERPAEMIAAQRIVLVNRVPHLKLSALRAMLSDI
ncbi:hypothetical protein ABT304_21100 [Nocardioides sp. NPDC000445]|uniref:hypothetical protein n=1 Tax=Nocardioides sp. NPDC000445 TaxID=3154257 RepID=UPI00331E6A81